jgi:hypothetical protein
MKKKHIGINLEDDAYYELIKLCNQDMRSVPKQVAYLIMQEAKKRRLESKAADELSP